MSRGNPQDEERLAGRAMRLARPRTLRVSVYDETATPGAVPVKVKLVGRYAGASFDPASGVVTLDPGDGPPVLVAPALHDARQWLLGYRRIHWLQFDPEDGDVLVASWTNEDRTQGRTWPETLTIFNNSGGRYTQGLPGDQFTWLSLSGQGASERPRAGSRWGPPTFHVRACPPALANPQDEERLARRSADRTGTRVPMAPVRPEDVHPYPTSTIPTPTLHEEFMAAPWHWLHLGSSGTSVSSDSINGLVLSACMSGRDPTAAMIQFAVDQVCRAGFVPAFAKRGDVRHEVLGAVQGWLDGIVTADELRAVRRRFASVERETTGNMALARLVQACLVDASRSDPWNDMARVATPAAAAAYACVYVHRGRRAEENAEVNRQRYELSRVARGASANPQDEERLARRGAPALVRVSFLRAQDDDPEEVVLGDFEQVSLDARTGWIKAGEKRLAMMTGSPPDPQVFVFVQPGPPVHASEVWLHSPGQRIRVSARGHGSTVVENGILFAAGPGSLSPFVLALHGEGPEATWTWCARLGRSWSEPMTRSERVEPLTVMATGDPETRPNPQDEERLARRAGSTEMDLVAPAMAVWGQLSPDDVAYAGAPERGKYMGFAALHDLMDANQLLPDSVPPLYGPALTGPDGDVSPVWIRWANAVEGLVGRWIVETAGRGCACGHPVRSHGEVSTLNDYCRWPGCPCVDLLPPSQGAR